MTARRRLAPPPRRFDWRTLVGVVLIGAAAYSAGSTYHQGEQMQERADCQAQVNGAFLAALVERDTANRGLADAQRDLILAPAASVDADARAAANRRYLAALQGQTQAREQNPLPKVTPC